MDTVKWDDSLSVGVKLIDEQHMQLIQHLNALSMAIKSHEGEREITNTLGFLIDYTDFHFSTEEKHMQASEYPHFDEHKALHEEFKTTLGDLSRDYYEEGSTKQLADAMETLLLNWLIKHIRGIDHKFADYLREKNIEISS